jgi:hypothetical protein
VTNTLCTDEGYNYNIVSGVDHLELDSIKPLTMIVCINIWDTTILLQVHQDNTNLSESGVNGSTVFFFFFSNFIIYSIRGGEKDITVKYNLLMIHFSALKI